MDDFRTLVNRMEVLWAESQAKDLVDIEVIGRVLEIRDISRTASDLLAVESLSNQKAVYVRAMFGAVELRAMQALDEYAAAPAGGPYTEAVAAIADVWALFTGLAGALQVLLAPAAARKN